MSHLTVRSAYEDLASRINRFPQGAPPTDLLFAILKLLFSEREAGLVAQLPIRPFTVNDAAARWKMPEAEAQKVLDALSDARSCSTPPGATEATLTSFRRDGGFFEFSMMRVRNDLDQKLLATLFYQYLNVEEDFIRDLFGRVRRGSVGCSSTKPRCRPSCRCTCWTTSGPARWRRPPTPSAWASATAVTRSRTSARPATRRRTSA